MEEDRSLEEFSEGAPLADEQARLSRRKFLTGAVAGGAAGLAVAAGSSVAVWRVTNSQIVSTRETAAADLEAAQDAAEVELGGVVGDAAEELAKLLGLLDLYQELDKIDLDGIIEKGLAAAALSLAALEAGARALKSGLEWAERALLAVAEAIPTAEEALLWLEARVSALADAIESLENSVALALERATDNAVGEAVKEFVTKILDALPFGLGDKFRAALDGLVTLVTSVDDLVEGINTKLLEPLRENWFSGEEDGGVSGTFFDPLVIKILDPMEEHLDNLAALADTWQTELATPAQQAITTRASLRAEIDRYKEEYGLT